jgi:hypothetical protein
VAGRHYRQGKRLEGESLLSPGEFAAARDTFSVDF